MTKCDSNYEQVGANPRGRLAFYYLFKADPKEKEPIPNVRGVVGHS
jgi:hypothetical protein